MRDWSQADDMTQCRERVPQFHDWRLAYRNDSTQLWICSACGWGLVDGGYVIAPIGLFKLSPS
jgi:ribosomal protein L37AE/L43A